MIHPLAAIDVFVSALRQVPPQVMLILLALAGEAARRRLHRSVQEVDDEVDKLADHHEELGTQVAQIDTKQDEIAVRQNRMMDKLEVNTDDIRDLEVEHARQDSEAFRRDHGSRNGQRSGPGQGPGQEQGGD